MIDPERVQNKGQHPRQKRSRRVKARDGTLYHVPANADGAWVTANVKPEHRPEVWERLFGPGSYDNA
jgi:hypothetical protein